MPELKSNLESNATIAGTNPAESSSSRWKGPLLAVLLSLLVPGLGQVRNREPWKGLLLAAASLMILAGGWRILLSFKGMIGFLVFAIVWRVLICLDAFRGAGRRRDSRKSFQERRLAFSVSSALIATLTFFSSANYFLHQFGYARAYKVPSASMCPTICEGDRIVADMDAFLKSGPRRGDVIMLKHGASAVLFIKRVIGVEGDLVSVRPGEVLVNGQLLAEPQHLEGCGEPSTKSPPNEKLVLFGEVKVPASSFFVVGDNLGNSFDSRFQGFGFVSSSQVRGRPEYIYWSPNFSRIGCAIR